MNETFVFDYDGHKVEVQGGKHITLYMNGVRIAQSKKITNPDKAIDCTTSEGDHFVVRYIGGDFGGSELCLLLINNKVYYPTEIHQV